MAETCLKTIPDEAMKALKTGQPLPAVPVKEVEFKLMAPTAKEVYLVGDFTEWELHPIQMKKTDNGIWSTTAGLAAGSYAYRFIADGKWRDDALAALHAPNLFGGQNAMVKVG